MTDDTDLARMFTESLDTRGRKRRRVQPEESTPLRPIPWAGMAVQFKNGSMKPAFERWYKKALKHHKAGKTDKEIRRMKAEGRL